MTNATTFWDKIAPKYAKDPIKDLPAYEYTLGRTRSYLTPQDRVLELGCGTGSTALQLASDVRQITGTDLSPEMVKIAQRKARDAGVHNADFQVHTAHAAAQLTAPFDVVLGFNLFHLARGHDAIFADIHQMLPTGGYFISKTPCLADRSFGFKRHLIRAMIPPMQWIGKAPFVQFLTQRQLEDAVKSAGFEIVEAGNFPAISRYIVARKR